MNADATAVVRELARSPLFAGLGPPGLQRLAGECHVRRFAKQTVIFSRGDPGRSMLLTVAGSVALSVASAEGTEVVLAVLRPPAVFGELAIIDGGPRVATATAREPTVLVTIPRPAVMDLLEGEPGFALGLLRIVVRLVRSADDRAADLVLLSLQARVEKFLTDAASASQRDDGPRPSGCAVPVDLRMTQTDLARLVGGSRQQVNRIVLVLEERGAIERSGTRIVAVRPERLMALH